MNINWTQPIEHVDGTPLVLRPLNRGANPDNEGDYYVLREDGLLLTPRQMASSNRDWLILRPNGTEWSRDREKVLVRNRIAPASQTTITTFKDWAELQGFKYHDGATETAPADFDASFPCLLRSNGKTNPNSGVGRWKHLNRPDDIIGYHALPPKPATFTLELTADEVSALGLILHAFGGCPSTSPRRHTIGILEKLPLSAQRFGTLSEWNSLWTDQSRTSLYFNRTDAAFATRTAAITKELTA